jgi:hypothetical protein
MELPFMDTNPVWLICPWRTVIGKIVHLIMISDRVLATSTFAVYAAASAHARWT